MTPAQAAALLTIAASFDNRKPDADQAKAWAMAQAWDEGNKTVPDYHNPYVHPPAKTSIDATEETP